MFDTRKFMNSLRFLAAGSVAFVSVGAFAADGQAGLGAWGNAPMAASPSATSLKANGNGSNGPVAAVRAEDALNKKVEASYTRYYLSEIVGDLRNRAGLVTVYPLVLNRTFNFTLADKNADVKTILDKVVVAGALDKEIKNGVVIFSQKADDKLIADLIAKAQDADRWKRCEAVWQLSNLADKRIYPALFKAAADSDPGVVYWTLKGLLAHLCVLPYVDDAAKDNVVNAIKKQTDQYPNDESFIRDYFRMLGAVSTPLSFDTLSGYLKSSDPVVRLNAVLGLEQCKEPRAAEAYQTAIKEPIIADRKKIADNQAMGAFANSPSYAKLDVRVNDAYLPPEMGNVRNPAIRDVMMDMIRDQQSSAEEKKYAASVLGNYLNDNKSIGDGVATLSPADHDVKKSAAFGINAWGGGMIAGAVRWPDDRRCNHDTRWIDLIATFLKDSDAKVRDQAIQTFGKMGNPFTTHSIIDILKNGNDEDKISALRGLDPNYGAAGFGQGFVPSHRIADPLLLEAVTPLLTSANAREQKISAMVLTTYGEARAKDGLFNHVNEQLVAVEYKNMWGALHEKAQTLKLMTQQHDTRAVDELANMLKDKNGMMYRQQLVACLAFLADPHGNEALLELARDKNADVNARAAVALSLVNSKSDAQVKVGIEALVDVMKSFQFAPWEAMSGLSKAKGGADAVISFLKDNAVEAAKRSGAAELLSSWELDAGTTDKFVALLGDQTIDATVRSAIGRGLSGFRFGAPKPEKVDARVVEFLIKAFKGTAAGDESGVKIAQALAFTRDSKALETLNEALKGNSENLKKDAALGLGSIADVRALDTLIALLNASDSKTVNQFNWVVNAYIHAEGVADADKAKAKAAVDAAAPKVRAAQEEQMQQAMKQFNQNQNNQKPVKPPAPPSKSDF